MPIDKSQRHKILFSVFTPWLTVNHHSSTHNSHTLDLIPGLDINWESIFVQLQSWMDYHFLQVISKFFLVTKQYMALSNMVPKAHDQLNPSDNTNWQWTDEIIITCCLLPWAQWLLNGHFFPICHMKYLCFLNNLHQMASKGQKLKGYKGKLNMKQTNWVTNNFSWPILILFVDLSSTPQ